MQEYFEIVIFTAAVKEYADWILNKIDPTSVISYWLYWDHTSSETGTYIKDLSKLGWDLGLTIIIDNSAENFQL